MQVFKRGLWSLIKSLVIAVVTGFVVGVVCSMFLEGLLTALIPAAVFLALLYLALFSENIRFEVEGDRLRYYQKGKLRGDYYLPECAARSRVVTRGGFPTTYDIDLYLTDLANSPDQEENIDCSALGYNQFARLYQLIEEASPDPVQKLETTKA